MSDDFKSKKPKPGWSQATAHKAARAEESQTHRPSAIEADYRESKKAGTRLDVRGAVSEILGPLNIPIQSIKKKR